MNKYINTLILSIFLLGFANSVFAVSCDQIIVNNPATTNAEYKLLTATTSFSGIKLQMATNIGVCDSNDPEDSRFEDYSDLTFSSESDNGTVVCYRAKWSYQTTYHFFEDSQTIAGIDTMPVITLLGNPDVNVEVNSTYSDAGATAKDSNDDITGDIKIVNSVDPTTIGIYTVTYNVTDDEGNAATQVTRIVNIVDTTSPIITLLGESTITLRKGNTYIDAGATATDNYDGNLDANIVVVNSVNTAIVGTYTVTYDVTDTAGNAATQVIRTVNVIAPATSGGGGTRITSPVTPEPITMPPIEEPVTPTQEITPTQTTPQPIVTNTPTENTNSGTAPITAAVSAAPTTSGSTGFLGLPGNTAGNVGIGIIVFLIIGAIGYFFFLKKK